MSTQDFHINSGTFAPSLGPALSLVCPPLGLLWLLLVALNLGQI